MASLAAISYFMPILAFLLVFLVIYAVLKKTEIIGGSEPVILFVSFILASFFIMQASLVEWVKFSGAWFSVIVIAVFFLVLIFGLVPGKDPQLFLLKNNMISWAIVGVILALFILSSAYVFNWVLNWEMVQGWFSTDWFGLLLLVVLAAIVSWKIKDAK